MDRRHLDQLMESWARWVHHGQLIARYGFVMEKLIANKGVMSFGTGGKASPLIDCVEARIEVLLMDLMFSDFNVSQTRGKQRLRPALTLHLLETIRRMYGFCLKYATQLGMTIIWIVRSEQSQKCGSGARALRGQNPTRTPG